ncbi:hypothetical protein BCF33_1727 [Hasllibacter halocynthiae]|uniref:Invasion protein IalB n=1 Tax=Hasllibacter halocynthiae TaxID=595589 RepID=A0A2T0X1V0_9RHOB|nr:invasion associated locus B family protein [Hasllibacter halocynthiae]PRY92865.1 hypothetical protein BCF33_1727 [Hasllibacter halocynthiae]
MTGTLARAALAATLALGGAAAAQESTNRVAAQTDWSVFVESDPTECWGVSAPKEQANTRDGQPVTVRRGDALLFIAYRPGSDVEGEVSFTGGYPFADGSTVSMNIGGDSYELFTEGEWAWPADAEEDAEIIASMRRGAEAVLVGESGRGTRTEDTFSLLGFTAALEEAGSRCGG